MRRRQGETGSASQIDTRFDRAPRSAPSHAKVEAADAGQVGRHVRDVVSALELAVVWYLSWSSTGRLHQPLGDVTPVEFDALSDLRDETPTMIKLEPTRRLTHLCTSRTSPSAHVLGHSIARGNMRGMYALQELGAKRLAAV